MPLMKFEDEDTGIKLETIKPNENLPVGHLSVSQVSMYLKCGQQYAFRYIGKIVSPPSIALVEGSSYHKAMEIHNEVAVIDKEGIDTSMATEIFNDSFSTLSKEIDKNEWSKSEDKEKDIRNRFPFSFSKYKQELSKTLIPTEQPEKKFEIEIGGYPTIGFIDLETRNSVIDYKTGKQVKSIVETAQDLQLSIYSGVTGKSNVSFCCFVKTKTPNVVLVESTRTQAQITYAKRVIISVGDAICKGAFPLCQPSSWWCNERFCGYWNLCRGKRTARKISSCVLPLTAVG